MLTADELIVSEALAALAHELRTPLTAIRGFAEILAGLDDSEDGVLRHELTARLLRNTAQLEAIVDSILDTVIHAHAESLHPERVSLRALARDVVDDAGFALGLHPCDVHGEPAFAVADRHAVTRILLNLLTNAAGFSPDGAPIDVETQSSPNGSASIVVTDSGPGIPEADRAAVFQPFWRSELARQRCRGLGVGLTIARDLCVMSGGDITVSDAPLGGARFVVHLPGSA